MTLHHLDPNMIVQMEVCLYFIESIPTKDSSVKIVKKNPRSAKVRYAQWLCHLLCMLGLDEEIFNLTQFKDWQLNAILAVVHGEDPLVVQLTGSHKSLCFQFWLKKSTTVITPPVSLMSDVHLNQEGSRWHFLGSAQSDKMTCTRVLGGEPELVFVTPESFFKDDGTPKHFFRQLLE